MVVTKVMVNDNNHVSHTDTGDDDNNNGSGLRGRIHNKGIDGHAPHVFGACHYANMTSLKSISIWHASSVLHIHSSDPSWCLRSTAITTITRTCFSIAPRQSPTNSIIRV